MDHPAFKAVARVMRVCAQLLRACSPLHAHSKSSAVSTCGAACDPQSWDALLERLKLSRQCSTRHFTIRPDAHAATSSNDPLQRGTAHAHAHTECTTIEFKLQGNYRGALNAYSRALLLEPPHPSPLLANRAACHFKLGDAAACRTDCSAALEMVRGQLGSLEEVGGLVSACNSGAHASREHVHSVDGRPQGEAIRGEQSETASQQLPQGSMKDQPAAETAADEAPPAPRQPTTAAPVAPAAAAPETEGERLRRLLTKLLARRAAASAQLGELVVAEQDLVEALR